LTENGEPPIVKRGRSQRTQRRAAKLKKLGLMLGAIALGLAGAALAIAGTGTVTSGSSVEGQALTAPIATYTSALTGNQRFIYGAYQDILGRAPTNSDLAAWTAAMDSGTTRTQVASALLHTDEYRGLLVDSIYQSFLHRAPDSSERANGIALLGSVADELYKAVILGSPEFFTTQGGGTVAGFLDALYQDVLGRPIDPTALAAYESQIAAGATNSQVAYEVLTSTEAREVLVKGYYQHYLHRAADATGLNAYVAALGGGSSDEDVIAAIVGTDEYLTNAATSTASIDWGDGSPASTVTFAVNTAGTGTISGSHTYTEEGAYPVGVTVHDIDGTFTISGTNTVGDAALTATPESITVEKRASFTETVATFTDANPGAPVSDFTATIDWGDGTTSAGTITALPGGGFAVSGDHEYKRKGTYSVTVDIADDGGSTATAVSTIDAVPHIR
jgi:hypothetical protein